MAALSVVGLEGDAPGADGASATLGVTAGTEAAGVTGATGAAGDGGVTLGGAAAVLGADGGAAPAELPIELSVADINPLLSGSSVQRD